MCGRDSPSYCKCMATQPLSRLGRERSEPTVLKCRCTGDRREYVWAIHLAFGDCREGPEIRRRPLLRAAGAPAHWQHHAAASGAHGRTRPDPPAGIFTLRGDGRVPSRTTGAHFVNRRFSVRVRASAPSRTRTEQSTPMAPNPSMTASSSTASRHSPRTLAPSTSGRGPGCYTPVRSTAHPGVDRDPWVG